MPLGSSWNLNSPSSVTTVWPALLPPWLRIARSARSASRSMILPLPSSPHCPPTTMMTIGFRLSVGRAWPAPVVGTAAPHVEVLEPRQLGPEAKVDGPGGTVPVLGHDDLRDAGGVGLVVVALAVQEDHDVRVLLN